LEVEELESDCGVHVEDTLNKEWGAGKVQDPNEILKLSVHYEFVHYVIQSLRQAVWYLFAAGQCT
jgi:hypothetical protein